MLEACVKAYVTQRGEARQKITCCQRVAGNSSRNCQLLAGDIILTLLSSHKASSNYRSVVIIGASAAGLFTAYLLAKAGRPVLLFEERETLGPPSRMLIITPRMKDLWGAMPSAVLSWIKGTNPLCPDAGLTCWASGWM